MSELLSGTLIYLHGFQSSSKSQKATSLKTFLETHPEYSHLDFVSPDLPFSPARTIKLVSELIETLERPLIMGSSMGGLYAAWCSQTYLCPAVLINPVADALYLFEPLRGQTIENIYTGERFVFQKQDMKNLKAISEIELKAPGLILNLMETGDEVLDYRLAQKKYKLCSQKVLEGGNHRFQNFENCLPEIMAFYQAQQRTS